MKAPRAELGFTLLEVLVALVVLSFIVMGLAGGTWLGERATKAQVRSAAEHQDLQPVDQLLRRLVAGITKPGDPLLPGLVGERNGLICVTRDPAPGAGTIPTRVDALVTRVGHRLLLRWSPHVHGTQLLAQPAPLKDTLMDGVEQIEFSYLAPDRSSWLSGWNRVDLPALIRIQLYFAPDDPRHWPPITVALRESAS